MAELHIDSDWKKQAQEEKKRLAEQEEKRKAAAAAQPTPGAIPGAPAGAGASAARGRKPGEARELPPASLAVLVQQLLTQAFLYMGELATRGQEPMLNLDMAKHTIDLLGVLEEKTKNNLTPEEKQMLDTALYELRMRFVSLASQVASYP